MYFNEKMKLADMVLANPKLLYVFPRFGIQLGFGEATAADACRRLGVSLPLFLLVCNVYANADYHPSAAELAEVELAELVGYLHRSHADYLDLQIANLYAKVMGVAESCGKSGGVLSQFFKQYVAEIEKHFAYEEEVVFPYVRKVISSGPQQGYSIMVYEQNHTDVEEKLDDLKNILLKYVPQNGNFAQREALRELFLFEDDLNRHSLIEDRILVPIVLELEKQR